MLDGDDAFDVEAAYHDWPDDYVKGVGWVQDTENEPEEPPELPVRFGDYALAYVRGLSGVAPRTRHDYERDLTNHLLPVFGELDIRDSAAITPALVREWVNGLQIGQHDPEDPSRWRRRPLRPKTIRNVHGLLVAILQAAVEADPPLRASNPAAGSANWQTHSLPFGHGVTTIQRGEPAAARLQPRRRGATTTAGRRRR